MCSSVKKTRLKVFPSFSGSKEPGWTPCKSGQSDEQRSARSDEAHRGVETQDRHGDTGTKAGGSQVGITQAVGENAASGMIRKHCTENQKANFLLFVLQIPPPKPPPPEMHFIPNPANTEFICLMGLEECVSKILNEDKENSIQPVPFSCSQCGTDFTPTWKWDKAAKGISKPKEKFLNFIAFLFLNFRQRS